MRTALNKMCASRARRRLRFGLMCSAALLAPLYLSAAQPANAQCVQSGASATCSGNDNDGFTANQALSITVSPGANVEATGAAITFAPGTAGNQLTNRGTVNGKGGGVGDAIGVLYQSGAASGDNTFTNNATIAANRNSSGPTGAGIRVDLGGGNANLHVVNAGGANINATATSGIGVEQRFSGSSNGAFTLENAGFISGTTYGVAAGGGGGANSTARITNTGQIQGGRGSLLLGDANAMGLIDVINSGNLQGAVTIDNAGTTQIDNQGTINGNVTAANDGVFFFRQRGNINGGITVSGAGANTLQIDAGRNVNGLVSLTGRTNEVQNHGIFNQGLKLNGTERNAVVLTTGAQINQVFSITGGGANSVDNAGTLNNGLTITGDGGNSVISRAGARINQILSLTGNGQNSVDNAGIVNNGVTFAGNGLNLVINRPNATINQDIVSTGNARDRVRNAGLINNAVRTGNGADVVINGPTGTINGGLDTGAGVDLFAMQGGRVQGNVNLGDGPDGVVMTGGEVTTTINTNAGVDRVFWFGGNMAGLNTGDAGDVATFVGLRPDSLAPGKVFDGGAGDDRLIWFNTQSADVPRYRNWESIELYAGSRLTFSSTLTLGDSGTGAGTLYIASSGVVIASNGAHAVAPFTAGQAVLVQNSGVIDLSNGVAGDTFTVYGNYFGNNGVVRLDTFLGADGSPSDLLRISGVDASASGLTRLSILNVGGPGAETTEGILVVEAVDEAFTTASAFALSGIVAAGPYEYRLRQGGLTDGSEFNWYLSTQAEPEPPDPPDPIPPDPPEPNPPDPPDPGPDPGPDPSPLPPDPPRPPHVTPPLRPNYRPETPVHSAAPQVVHSMLGELVGTFHERRGDQTLLDGAQRGAAWGRVIGRHGERAWAGDAAPSVEGDIAGMQAGFDAYAAQSTGGAQSRAGLMLDYVSGDFDVSGTVFAQPGRAAGSIESEAYGLGFYYTYIGASGWYADAVALLTHVETDGQSYRGIGASAEGDGYAMSLEIGAPFQLSDTWVIEPQGQLVWQDVDLGATRDRFSTIDYGSSPLFTARVGARAEGAYSVGDALYRPFVSLDFWNVFDGEDRVVFRRTAIETKLGHTSYEIGAGLSAETNGPVSGFVRGSYSGALDPQDEEALSLLAGVNYRW